MKQRRQDVTPTADAAPPAALPAAQPQDTKPSGWKKWFVSLVVHPIKSLVGLVIAAVIVALAPSFVMWGDRLVNHAIPGRPVADVDLVGAPPVDAASADSSSPVAYNAYAFPEALAPAQMRELNAIVARQDHGATTPAEEARVWMRKHGAYDVGGLVVRVVVQALDQPVRVMAVRAVVKERKQPLTGTVLYTPPQGSDDVVVAALNLDVNQPTAPYFGAKTESLEPGESVVIDVEASISKWSMVWQIGIDLRVAGATRTELVNAEDGQPFRTTGLPSGVPKQSGTGAEFLRQYPDPWWFRYASSDAENPAYVPGLPTW